MPAQSKKRPRDPNQLAKLISGIATGEVSETPDARDPAAVERGRLGGVKGGVARKKSLSAEQRKLIAEKAAAARWKKTS